MPRIENYKYSNSKSLEYTLFYASPSPHLQTWLLLGTNFLATLGPLQSRGNFQINLDSSLTLLTSNVPSPHPPSADTPLKASARDPGHPNKGSLLHPLHWCSRAGTRGRSWRAWFALPEPDYKRPPRYSSPGSSSGIELHSAFLWEKCWKSRMAQKRPLHSPLPSHLLHCTSLWLLVSFLAPIKPRDAEVTYAEPDPSSSKAVALIQTGSGFFKIFFFNSCEPYLRWAAT